MKSSELDRGVAEPVESDSERTFRADVFVVEWEVALDPPAGAEARAPEPWWRNEGAPMRRDGA